MRLQRKLKKRIIKVFGRGTYRGIIQGFFKIEKYQKNYGCITKFTTKRMTSKDYPYSDYQFNPYLTFKNIY